MSQTKQFGSTKRVVSDVGKKRGPSNIRHATCQKRGSTPKSDIQGFPKRGSQNAAPEMLDLMFLLIHGVENVWMHWVLWLKNARLLTSTQKSGISHVGFVGRSSFRLSATSPNLRSPTTHFLPSSLPDHARRRTMFGNKVHKET